MRQFMLAVLAAALALAVSGCSSETTLNETGTMLVTLPGGQQIKAELMTNPKDMMRGMMFRDSLAPDRGMLFIHGAPGRYGYWMYQVKVPLDIIWMSPQHRVVEISRNTPPCTSKSSRECPSYGGTQDSVYVLELPAGSVDKYKINVGDTIAF